MLGSINDHIRKNLIQNGEPQSCGWERRTRRRNRVDGDAWKKTALVTDNWTNFSYDLSASPPSPLWWHVGCNQVTLLDFQTGLVWLVMRVWARVSGWFSMPSESCYWHRNNVFNYMSQPEHDVNVQIEIISLLALDSCPNMEDLCNAPRWSLLQALTVCCQITRAVIGEGLLPWLGAVTHAILTVVVHIAICKTCRQSHFRDIINGVGSNFSESVCFCSESISLATGRLLSLTTLPH